MKRLAEKREAGDNSCNDGFRPVRFLIEATGEDAD